MQKDDAWSFLKRWFWTLLEIHSFAFFCGELEIPFTSVHSEIKLKPGDG